MRFLKPTLICAVAFFCALTATAQITEANYREALSLGYQPYPYSFVQVQGGLGTTFTNKAFSDLLVPTASVAYGRFFGSGVGARIHVNGWQSKGGFKSIDKTYNFNYLNTNLDLLLNLTNIFSKKNSNAFNVILVAGLGLNYAWGNDDMDKILASSVLPAESTANAWGKGKSHESLYSHNLRAGLLFDFNLSKNINIGLEIDMNSLSDRFNSKYSNKDDWMMTAQVGVTYKFGFKTPQKPDPAIIKKVVIPEPEPEPVVTPEPEPEPEPVVAPEPTPVVTPIAAETTKAAEVKVTPIKETIYYFESHTALDESNQYESKIGRIAEWAKKYPTGKITVYGYADKGTGIPERNLKYSKQRAENVAKALREAGVSESQIDEVDGFGDTIQPYPDNNDWNRCVIIEGK